MGTRPRVDANGEWGGAAMAGEGSGWRKSKHSGLNYRSAQRGK